MTLLAPLSLKHKEIDHDPLQDNSSLSDTVDLDAQNTRADELFRLHRDELHVRIDRLFTGLMAFQWLACILAAFVISPQTWYGSRSQIHEHVWFAAILGGIIASLPIYFGIRHPGAIITRHVIAISQMLMSALIIDLTGGRIESHFHVFGSLAFLAFYRDWRVLITATVVIAVHHLIGGLFFAREVFGTSSAGNWRWVEHAGWVGFADVFLVYSCVQSTNEMKSIAERQAQLESANAVMEAQDTELRRSRAELELRVQERTIALAEANHTMQQEVVDRKKAESEVRTAYAATIEGWSRALELRDKETQGHSQRVTEITLRLCRKAGLGLDDLYHVRHGALLHDIGKMGIPDEILLKPGKLTPKERQIVEEHPGLAYDLLVGIAFLAPALSIPRSHHERWDGTGYPQRLSGEQIPLEARLFAIADVYDALRSDRPYRDGMPFDEVIEYIRDGAGTQFDPKCVEYFLEMVRRGELQRIESKFPYKPSNPLTMVNSSNKLKAA